MMAFKTLRTRCLSFRPRCNLSTIGYAVSYEGIVEHHDYGHDYGHPDQKFKIVDDEGELFRLFDSNSYVKKPSTRVWKLGNPLTTNELQIILQRAMLSEKQKQRERELLDAENRLKGAITHLEKLRKTP